MQLKSDLEVLCTKYSIKDDADSGIVLYWPDGEKFSIGVDEWENGIPQWVCSGQFATIATQTEILAFRSFSETKIMQEIKIGARLIEASLSEDSTLYNISVFRSFGQPRPAVLPESVFNELMSRTIGGDNSRIRLMPKKKKFIYTVAFLLQSFIEKNPIMSFSGKDLEVSLITPLNEIIDAVNNARKAESLVSSASSILGWNMDKEAAAA